MNFKKLFGAILDLAKYFPSVIATKKSDDKCFYCSLVGNIVKCSRTHYLKVKIRNVKLT